MLAVDLVDWLFLVTLAVYRYIAIADRNPTEKWQVFLKTVRDRHSRTRGNLANQLDSLEPRLRGDDEAGGLSVDRVALRFAFVP